MPQRFTQRLFVLFALGLVFFCAATFFALFPSLEELTENAVKGQLEATGELLVRAWDADEQSFKVPLEPSLDFRLTIVEPDGRVGSDTHQSSELMENHGSRPEVSEALTGRLAHERRQSETLHIPMTYLARPLDETGRTLRIAVATSSIDQALTRIRNSVVWGLLIGATVSMIILVLLARWLSAPLETLSSRLRRGEEPGFSEHWPLEIKSLAQTLSRQLDTLERQRQRAKRLLENLQDAVILLDSEGNPLLANQAAEAYLSAKPEWLASHLEARTGGGEKLEWRSRHLQVKSTFLDGECLVVIKDITEFENLDRKRRDFVANASHELRTPVTAITVLLEALEMGAKEEPERRDRFLAKALDHSARLRRLTTELLELAQVEHQADVQGPQSPVVGLLQALEDDLRPLLKGKRQRLRTFVELPETLTMPADSLSRMLYLLLENAIDFSPPESVLELRAVFENNQLLLEIKDKGPGIPEEFLERVFERFFRVDSGRHRDSGGTGLGLAIARHLAGRLGGSLSLRNAPEGGLVATFKSSPKP